jgi:hypothetical protein
MGDGLTIGQKIVTWASGHTGKKIGRGECWDLADQALRSSGALSSADLGPMDRDADYVWGDPVPDLKDVLPGDILQFRDHVVTTTIVTEASWADGATWTQRSTQSAERGPQHTAIVATNQGNGVLAIYEQNAKPKGRVVQLNTLNTKDVVSSTRKFKKKLERPVAPRKGLLEMADIAQTTTLEVSGKIWAYRPKLRSK